MFSNLLAELDATIKSANSSIKKVQKENSSFSNTIRSNQQFDYDPRLKSGVAPSFPKSNRFKQLEKQQLTSWDADQITKKVQTKMEGGVIGKQQRFKPQKKYGDQTLLYPKDTLTKKSVGGAVITPLREKDLDKSIISVSTAAGSIADLAPLPKAQITKTPSFTKGKRFVDAKTKYNDQIPLYPKQTLTRKRPPSAAVIVKKTKKNEKQLMKQRQELLRQRLRIIQWKQVPFEIDRYFKNSIGPVLKKQYFDISTLTGRQKTAAMRLLLQKLNIARGGFQSNLQTSLQAPCAVIYRKSAPKPFKFPQITPAPDEYYPVEDLVKPSAAAFSFAKFDPKKILIPDDPRDYQISQQIGKNAPNVIINPQHKHIPLTQTQLASLKRGPGFYQALFSQVQKRDDIGVIKLPKLTQNNDRVNNLGQKKQVNDGIYFPQYTQLDKNIGVPLYKTPADVKPQHIPEALLFPQHWMFYDGDLNKVRAQVAKNVMIAGGLSFQQYAVYAQNVKQFKQYLKRQQKHPQHGQYEITYKGIDKDQPGFEISKMQQKGLIDPIVKQQGDVAGDNLLLEPNKPKPKIPSFDIGKMIGREEIDDSDQPKPGDVLIINPTLPGQKMPNIDFNKMIGRQQNNQVPQQGPFGDRLIINPQIPQKHIGVIDFSKHQGRQEADPISEQKQQIKLNINYEPIYPRVKGSVKMERMKQVRLVAHLRKQKQDQQ